LLPRASQSFPPPARRRVRGRRRIPHPAPTV